MVNKALVFKKVPQGYPVAGQDLVIEEISYDSSVATPKNGVVLESLYASFDPYMRGRMRNPEIKSYAPPFTLNKPVVNDVIGKVLKSDNAGFKEGDLVIGQLPLQQFVALDDKAVAGIKKLENPLGLEDIRVFLGPLIGKPKKGETIFVSAASGAVGQIVGQLAKHEGLRVIGSVGSDEKLDFILKDLGFDAGFNYKKEKPADALKRLAPEGIDIYYENVGGEHMEAALDSLRQWGRVVLCGLISEYNSAPYPITNISNVLTKRLTVRGFIVFDPDMGPLHVKAHQENVAKWIKDGSFKVRLHQTDGIDNAADGLIGIFTGKNFGKAVLKF
ncbi:hypothetical protein N7468_007550 [Penicillium chermesinum]|uniref:Enoyl reductase (ER) domain-containing protein n=1 Tax=Penicillium chermesinum TaxID=63820 RepID=A0A9W9TMA2_9EURO|nr:uncharacterized protein N7468_007550 [Penicillium chermesinum]KAJ5226325.1 hypothetical protein N7468_007550 [Penicillium chermesinum]